ncbi:MAG: GNAT family N-acetyltransferase [Oscillospiraceae bacterium]
MDRFNCRVAKTSDINQLKILWKEAFGDTDEYINFFYNKGFFISTTFLYEEDGQITSMLSSFDVCFNYNKTAKKGSYIYAVATLKKFRGKKQMTKLMNFTEDYLLKKDYQFCTLVPQNKGLFDVYEKVGYYKFTKFNNIDINNIDIKLNKYTIEEFKSIDINKYFENRKSFLTNKIRKITFSEDSIEYLKSEIEFNECKALYNNAENYSLLYYELESTIIIREIITNFINYEIISDISNYFKTKNIKINQVADQLDSFEDGEYYSMIKALNKNFQIGNFCDVYMNLMLD